MTTFNGFEPANTTPVPDALFDRLLPELSGAELKVLLYIIRRTRGFKKETDAISLSQFTDGIKTREGKQLDYGCGIKNRTVVSKALADLLDKGCICSTKGKDSCGDAAVTIYAIRFNEGVVSKPYHPSIETVPPLVSKPYHGSDQSVPGVVSKPYPQETVLQDTVKQETVLQEREDVADATARSQPSLQKEVVDGDNSTHQRSLVDSPSSGSSTSTRRHSGSHNMVTHPPAPKKPPSNKTIPEPELTPDEQAVFDAWCSLFKVAVPLIPANARACKQLAKPLQVWTGILDKSTAEVLKRIMNWAYKNDKNGYYKRGFKLYDAAREFEGWQSAQERPQGDKEESNEHKVTQQPANAFIERCLDKDYNKRKLEEMRAKNALKRQAQAEGVQS